LLLLLLLLLRRLWLRQSLRLLRLRLLLGLRLLRLLRAGSPGRRAVDPTRRAESTPPGGCANTNAYAYANAYANAYTHTPACVAAGNTAVRHDLVVLGIECRRAEDAFRARRAMYGRCGAERAGGGGRRRGRCNCPARARPRNRRNRPSDQTNFRCWRRAHVVRASATPRAWGQARARRRYGCRWTRGECHVERTAGGAWARRVGVTGW
jgi:hypothetical protein